MKKMAFAALALLLGLGTVFAALTEADLSATVVNRTMKSLKGEARRTYAANILRAIAARPVDGATKVKELTRASRALILGAGSESILAIAEVYNTVPVEQLPGVAELLSKNNFAQAINKGADGKPLPDAVYDELVATIVKRCSEYIETSGTDSPALRISILAATFTSGSTSPDRTRAVVFNAVPASVRAAVRSYVPAAESGNREMIAAAAGVDSVDDTPADPDRDNVIAAKKPADAAQTPADKQAADKQAAEANAKAGSADAAKAVAAAAAGAGTNEAMKDAQGGRNAEALKSGENAAALQGSKNADALKASGDAAAADLRASNETAVANAKAENEAARKAKAEAAAKAAAADIAAPAGAAAGETAAPAAKPAADAAKPAAPAADGAKPAAPAADGAAPAADAAKPAAEPAAPAAKAEEPAAPAPAPQVGNDDTPEAAVPLLSRWISNKEGATMDLMLYTIYDWEAADPRHLIKNSPIPTLPGVGNPAHEMPGNSNLWQDKLDKVDIITPPSPGYANQSI